ncbi:MAG: STAS domain-containing protein [Planctomycetota bacterium]|jgi:anti-sigma B factor antagonist
MAIQVTREQVGDTVVVAVEGSVDIQTSPELKGELGVALDGQTPKLVVDMAGVSFIDSSGLATLIEAMQKMLPYKGDLRLCNLTTSVMGVFELANLDRIFQIKGSRDDALSA